MMDEVETDSDSGRCGSLPVGVGGASHVVLSDKTNIWAAKQLQPNISLGWAFNIMMT